MGTITQTEADIHEYQMEIVGKRVFFCHGGGNVGGSLSIEVQ